MWLLVSTSVVFLSWSIANALPNFLTSRQLPPDTPPPLVIDTFHNQDFNDLGFFHGPGEDLNIVYGQVETENLTKTTATTSATYPVLNVNHAWYQHQHTLSSVSRDNSTSYVRFYPTDPDHNYHTQLSQDGCFDLSLYRNADMFLHVVFSGTAKFSVSLNQNNERCDSKRMPYPDAWNSVEMEQYVSSGSDSVSATRTSHQDINAAATAGSSRGRIDAYIPLSHFDNIDYKRILSVSFNGFYTPEPVALYKVEIVGATQLPGDGVQTPPKLPNGRLVLKCTRPNSFAFGIDDGKPEFAEEIMRILEEENILVTFFAVGAGLRDEDANFTEVYKEMSRRGHQIALHSYSHPKMEGLDSIEDIDREIQKNVLALKEKLGLESRYFRPPFGSVGARLRQRLAALLDDPYIVNWSIDIEDWLWGESDTPERQIEAFVRDVDRGGNLAVLHYLYPSTVSYFRDLIHFVKSTGMQIMRVDQCLEDPNSPPLVSSKKHIA